jgi:TonB family protein
MGEGRRFKLSLLISFGIHLCLILFLPELRLAAPPPPPKYVEVTLIKPTPIQVRRSARKVSPKKPVKASQVKPKKVQPKPEKVKVEAVKVEAKAPKATAVEPKAPPRMPLLGISGGPSQKLPVSPPPVKWESPTKMPIPFVEEKPSLGGGTGDVGPLSSGMRRGISKERQVLPAPGGENLPPKAAFYVKGDLAYQGEGGEGGEGVSPGRIKGPAGGRRILRSVEPSYPAWAEASGVKGEVELKFWVSPAGEVSEVEVWKTSGWSGFDNSASQALRQWRFEPIEEKERQWGIIFFVFEFEERRG